MVSLIKIGSQLVVGFRTLIAQLLLPKTMTMGQDIILHNMTSDAVDKLVESIVDENGAFHSDLNGLFREEKNPTKFIRAKKIATKYSNDTNKKFLDYITETSPKEYYSHKDIVEKQKIKYFRNAILDVIKNKEDLVNGLIDRSEKGSMNYLIEEYVISSGYTPMVKDEATHSYSDSEVQKMIDRINLFLQEKPEIEQNYLDVYLQQKRYEKSKDGKRINIVEKGERRITKDEQIASRLAISYIMTLSDIGLKELAFNLGVITEEQKQILEQPYDSNDHSKHVGDTLKDTLEAYNKGQGHGQK